MIERIIGTRTSQLALWQTRHIIALLAQAWPDVACRTEPFVTQGDKTLDKPLPQIGGKGLFTQELAQALLDGRIHLAVHSLKDLPVENSPGLTLGAIVGRADVRDVLVAANGRTLATLPHGAIVGTSSLRRQSQLRRQRPDLDVRSIRGNVETRIRKVHEGQYDATILAAAGVTRLGLEEHVAEWLPLETMLPAPGQGALAVQCRADDAETLRLLAAIHQPEVAAAVTAERAFLHALGGGCATPVAAYAMWENGRLQLTGYVGAVDGANSVEVIDSGDEPESLGQELARLAIAQGAVEILARA
jgi:hydroxymethylbilane synthase